MLSGVATTWPIYIKDICTGSPIGGMRKRLDEPRLTTECLSMTRVRKNEVDDSAGDEEYVRRAAPPRFGPFLTIAVAILMLFGAASRIGKTENNSWLNLDLLANKSLEQEHLRLQEQRNTTLITLGAAPVQPQLPAANNNQSFRLDSRNALPPPRGDFDLEEYQNRQRLYEQRQNEQRRAALSLPVPTESASRVQQDDQQISHFDPAPEAEPVTTIKPMGGVYVVADGDNWVKIGKHTGRRWQDIQKANPISMDGLRVGMRLVIPGS